MDAVQGPPNVGYLGRLISDAKELGALDASTIWALVSMALSFYVYRSEKSKKDVVDSWQNIRIEEAKADLVMAQAVERLTNEVAQMKIIISERIPRRD